MDVVTEDTDLAWPEPGGRVDQPRRAFVALAELVAAGLLAWLTTWLWDHGVDVIGVVRDQPDLEVDRFQGNWIGGAVAAAVIGLILLLDAIRQLVLAVRARRR